MGSALPSRVSPFFRDGVHLYRQPSSGHSRFHQATQLRTDGVYHPESNGTEPAVLKVTRVTGEANSEYGTEANCRVRRSSTGPQAVRELHIHPSRDLWEARGTPYSSTTPPDLSNGSGLGSRGNGRGGWESSGGDEVPQPDDTFWLPVLPDVGSVPATEGSMRSFGSHYPAWLQQQQDRRAVRTGGWIDRPALRGQEYRREKKRKGQGNNKAPTASNSSLMKSGSHGQLPVVSTPDDPRQRFLGIPWPPGLLERGHSRVGSAGVRRANLYVRGQDEKRPDAVKSGVDGRLCISIEGHTEVGKGINGHTAYKIKVTHRFTGEQWTFLRRFRQFEELHQELLQVLSREPDANAYVLPPKEVFGGRYGGVIAKRLKLLKVYLDRLVTCSAAVEHCAMVSFLELDPVVRGLCAYGRKHGPECILKEGILKVKRWDGPHKPVINILEAGLGLIGWTSCYAIVSPGPVFLVYRSSEDSPDKPLWVLPARRTVGSQVRVRRVDFWKADLEKENTRFFLVSWEETSLLCQVESETSLERWAHALDEEVDLRPQQTGQERAKVDIELKAKEAWTSREEGIWGGL